MDATYTASDSVLATPPAPPSAGEAARWEHSRLRRRLLDGTYYPDLILRLQQHLGSVRRQAWGPPDLSSNPFRSLCRELAVLYVQGAPDVRHALELQGRDITGLLDAVAASGLWSQSIRFQSQCIGLREMFRRVDVDAEGCVTVRPVPPDLCLAASNPDCPSEPVAVRELRARQVPNSNKVIWTWDELDIHDPKNPTYRVMEARGDGKEGEDLTAMFLGSPSFSGADYPYRKTDGTPVLPYILYHAEDLGDRLFDTFEAVEAVEGSLTLMVLLSFWVHCVRDASWPQRWALNARPAGAEQADIQGDGARTEVVTDPMSMVVFVPIEEGSNTQIGQWAAGASASELQAAIQGYGTRLLSDAGVPPSDVERVGSDARSGYAISLTNEGKRAAQRRFSASFMQADQQLLATIATMLNGATGSNYPEDGYQVIYQGIPLSPAELQAKRTNILELLGAGLMGPTDAMVELSNGSLSREQAAADLVRITEEKANIAAGNPGKASEYALLGPQTAAMQGIIESVAAGKMSRQSGIAMLVEAFGKDEAAAAVLIGPETFTPTAGPAPLPGKILPPVGTTPEPPPGA